MVLAGLKRQTNRCETAREIETGAAFNADWLQRDRILGAANQHVGADPDPKRNACGRASVGAGQRSGTSATVGATTFQTITAFCTYPMSTPNFEIEPA